MELTPPAPTATETPHQGKPTLFVECSNTYFSSEQSGIQRVVRNVLRHAAVVAERHGYLLVPVVFEGGQFREADLQQVLDDKLQVRKLDHWTIGLKERWGQWRAMSPRQKILGACLPVYRLVRRTMAYVLPFPAVHRFLFAHPRDFGLGWCVLLPWRAVRKLWGGVAGTSSVLTLVATSPVDDRFGMSLDSVADHHGNILLMLDGSWNFAPWPAVARFQDSGGLAVSVIYDLIPITHPDAFMPSLCDAFNGWMAEHLRVTRRFVTISRTVAGELDTYLRRVTVGEADPGPWYIS